MNPTLVKVLVALIPIGVLFVVSIAQFVRGRTLASFLRILGAGCFVVVALTHVAEALRLFPHMHWGDPHSIGHYFDLTCAILGITLLLVGYLVQVVRRDPASRCGWAE